MPNFLPIPVGSAKNVVDCGVQTETPLLAYIDHLHEVLDDVRKQEISLRTQISRLETECSRYRYLWMTERRYSDALVHSGAELGGGYSQPGEAEGSSPYYRGEKLVECLMGAH